VPNRLHIPVNFVEPLSVDIQPTVLPARGDSRDVTLTANISYQQVQIIEELRTSSVILRFELSGYWLYNGAPSPFWGTTAEHEISQSEWIAMLEGLGYKRLILIELDVTGAPQTAEMTQARRYFDQAQKHYLEGEWRHAVESLRQCLATLVGRQADEEDQEADLQAALKELRNQTHSMNVGYAERLEPVRLALKFLCDLGAHPEVAETTKRDAYGALLMTAGLLQGLGGRR
jgi:hypothetical protein